MGEKTVVQDDFLRGPILPALMRFALPVLLALFLQALYGAVDLWAVGKFGTPADMSAVSTGSQAMLVLTGFITGLCMGVTVRLGQWMGEKNYQAAGETLGAALWIFLGLSVVVSAAMVLGAPLLARAVHAPEAAMDQTVHYLRICGGGTLCITAYNGISSLFRGMGNSKAPLCFVAAACLVNIAGDVILIRDFRLGAAGAAMATVGAQAVSVVLSLIFIRRAGLPFPVTPASLRFHPEAARDILRLGLPIALSDMCNEICYLVIIGFTNTLGVIVSAGVGVAEKLIVFLLLIPMSYIASISSFVAQNIGAGYCGRAKRAMWEGMATAAVLGMILSGLLFFQGDVLSLAFDRDPEVVQASAAFLKATALECLILSVAYCFTGYFNGIGRTTFVMVQGLLAIFLVKIPYAWFACRFLDHKLYQIGLSTVWGALFTLILCGIYYGYLGRKEEKLAEN